MEALCGSGMAEDKSLLERSMDGGYWASVTVPELPGDIAGGLEVIEDERRRAVVVGKGRLSPIQAMRTSHELRPTASGID